MPNRKLDFSRKKLTGKVTMQDGVLFRAKVLGQTISLVTAAGVRFEGRIKRFDKLDVELIGCMGGKYLLRRREIAAVIARGMAS